MNKIIECIKELNSFEGSLFVYSLSYALLLTIPPAMIVIIFSFRWIDLNINDIVDVFALFIPDEVLYPFVDFLVNENKNSIFGSMITTFISLFLSSRSIYSFLLIASRYERIEYPKWSLRIFSIYEFICIYLYGMICVIVNVLFFDSLGLSFLVYFSASFIGFYLFYHLCTFRLREWTYGLLGALFSTISIYFVGLLFFKSVRYFTNYENVYGPLSSIMLLFLSVFVISMIIYFGYILNNKFIQNKNEDYRKNTFFHLCVKIEKTISKRYANESRN